MSIHLINPFVVPDDKETEFLQAWNYTTFLYSQMPGFIETHMHKVAQAGTGRFQYVNVAVWSSDQTEAEAHRLHKPGEENISTVEHHPGTFEEIMAVQNLNGLQETGQSVHLINCFAVPNDQEEAFLQDWSYTTYRLSQMPGFIQTRMHKNNGSSNTSFQFANIAAWQTADDLKATRPPGPPKSAVPGVQVFPGIFHEAFVVKGLRGTV